MSSPNNYTLANRIEYDTVTQRKRPSTSRSAVMPKSILTTTSIRSENPPIHLTNEFSIHEQSSALPNNREVLLFVYLDLRSRLSSEQIEILRAINDGVRIYHDESPCYEFLHSCAERIFFICPTDEQELVRAVHDVNTIDAIFLVSSTGQIDRNRLPKLEGIYGNFESLTVGLKNALEWYDESQMDLFTFEHDRIFLWCQLWREELIKPTQPHPPSNKEKLVAMAEVLYQDNPKLIESLRQFDQSYSRSDAFQWCFYSPFPSRLLHQALRTRQSDTLDQCRFLINDVSRIVQQSSKLKSGTKLFRGMKLTKETVDRLEESFGQLICYKDYFACTKSRKAAIELATAQNHRPDLVPVLFKITADKSCPITELSSKNESPKIIFDFYAAFRVKYVVREGLTTIKLECVATDGKMMAKEYFNKFGVEHVTNLLNHCPNLPDPIPRRLPPLERAQTATKHAKKTVQIIDDLPDDFSSSVLPKPENEERVMDLIQSGDIDQAIDTFKRLKHVSAQLLGNIGTVYVEKKGDYDSAIKCFNKALKLKEKNGEDPSLILNQLAMAHENRQEFDTALAYHSRALELQQKNPNADKAAIVSSMLGIANGYCGQQNYSKALKSAKEALHINESITPQNEVNLAMNHAIIASILHRSEDTKKALKHARRALALLERSVPSDSPNLAALLNNVATMQLAAGLFSEARESFDRALKICAKTLPEGHPKRVTMENNLQRIIEMEQSQLEEISVEVPS